MASSIVAPLGSRTGRIELTMPRVMVPAKSERIADGIYLLPNLQVTGIAKDRRNEIGRLDLNDREIMRRVGPDDGRLYFLRLCMVTSTCRASAIT